MGTLYIVATPIGNLEDMTFRALRILKNVALIAAEDTRTSRVLTKHYEIDTPLTSYHEHNKIVKMDIIFDTLARGDVALISDAGTPGISDPGYELIHEAIKQDFDVVPIPGANAAISGLVASGLPTDSFTYIGFLPKKRSNRREVLAQVQRETRTLVAYESPHRLNETLALIIEIMGEERELCVAREITKMYEEFFRGTAQDALDYFTEDNPRGEVTLIIRGADKAIGNWDAARIQETLRERLDGGESLSRAAKIVADLSGWKKRDVYNIGLDDK